MAELSTAASAAAQVPGLCRRCRAGPGRVGWPVAIRLANARHARVAAAGGGASGARAAGAGPLLRRRLQRQQVNLPHQLRRRRLQRQQVAARLDLRAPRRRHWRRRQARGVRG